MRYGRWLCFLLALGCAGDSTGPDDAPVDKPDPAPKDPPPIGSGNFIADFTLVVDGLDSPVLAISPAGDNRLFVVEQPGRIRIVRNGSLEAAPFLDITDRVRSGGEQGLLGLAFHPEYASNGLLFVNYTDPDGTSRIERYRVSSDPDRAEPASAYTILSVSQPAGNHNGGHVEFGPDGLLYIALGDGGGTGDPNGRGQDRNTLLGKLLRIDVDGGDPYAIPADNPFRGMAAARGEIWALGLRNPWRFSIDGAGDRIYIADVGEMRREEINVARLDAAGLNYGWNIMEGSECFRTATCSTDGLTQPTVEYTHDAGECSVTGGYVYRGAAIPEMVGYYLYADYCNGWIRSFRMDADTVADHRQWDTAYNGRITSFGRDAQGELYVVIAGSAGAGRLLRIINRE